MEEYLDEPVSSSPMRDEAWRQALGGIVRSDKDVLKRVVDALGVREVTILRWCDGTTSPHKPMRTFQSLLQALPLGKQDVLLQAILLDYPDFQIVAPDEDIPIKEIPSIFYSRILHASATVSDPLAFWSIISLVSQQLYGHLDVDRSASMTITILRCTPPLPHQPVRSFYVPDDHPSERPNPLKQPFLVLLGAETMLTWAMMRKGPLVLHPDEFPPMLKAARVGSVVAQVIQHRGKVGGLLVLTSSALEFFTENRLYAIAQYALLAKLAFPESDFYPKDQIALGLFPSIEQQQASDLRYSIRNRARVLRREHPTLNQRELEQLALHNLEAELLQQESEAEHRSEPERNLVYEKRSE